MSIAAASPHVDALLALLAAGGVDCYLSRAATGATYGYTVLHPDAGTFLGEQNLADPFAELVATFTLTAVSDVPGGAVITADLARNVLLSGPVVVAGRSVRVFLLDSPALQRDEDGPNTVYYLPVVYRLYSCPA